MEDFKDYAEKADALARKHGYFCACYIGCTTLYTGSVDIS